MFQSFIFHLSSFIFYLSSFIFQFVSIIDLKRLNLYILYLGTVIFDKIKHIHI